MNSVPLRLSTWLAMGLLSASFPASAQTYDFNNVSIVGGGFITGIVAHPSVPGLFYVRTDIGGTYRWDPSTQRWKSLLDWVTPDNFNLQGTISVALDPTNAHNLYLAQGEYVESFAGNGAIYISNNFGQTFTQVNLPFQLGSNENGRFSGERLAVVPWSPATLYLGTNVNGLWISTDSANTWNQVTSFPITGEVNNDLAGVIFVFFGPKSKGKAYGTIYAGVSDPAAGLYQSTDNGATWQPIAGQPTGDVPTSAALSPNGNLYVTYSNQSGPDGAGNGQVWEYNLAFKAWTLITPPDAVSSPANYGYAKVVVDPNNPNTIMVSTLDRYYPGDEIFRSLNGGASWEVIGNEPYGPPPHSSFNVNLSPWLLFGAPTPGDIMGNWIGAMLVDPANSNHVMYGTGQTLYATQQVSNVDTGGVIPWYVGAAGIEETSALSLVSPPAEAHLLSALGDIGSFRHDDLHRSPVSQFLVPSLDTTTSIDFAQANPLVIARVGYPSYAQTLCGGYSYNQGNSWIAFTDATGCENGPGQIAVSANGSTFVWAPSAGPTVYSTDSGTTWTASAAAPASGFVVSDRVNPNNFYTFDQTVGTFYTSTDGGQTFTAGATGLGTYSLKQISVNPNTAGDIWLSLQWNGLWHSTDGGATFTELSTVVWPDSIGFGKPATTGGYPAIFFLGRLDWSGPGYPTSVYRSDDSGQTWNAVTDTEHEYGNINLVIGDPRIYGRVYIGTNGRGIVYGDLAQ